MSLIDRFSNKALCVGLSPGQIVCVLRKGDNYLLDSAHQQTVVNPDASWQAALTALRGYFQQQERAPHRTPLMITLASRWSRMMIVPWSDALLTEQNAKRFLQGQFVALYGERARDWLVVSDSAPYGQPRLACGIDAELLDALQQIALENKLQCRAVESIIAIAWRAIVAALGSGTKACAVIESGRLTLATTRRGRIVAIQSQACGNAWHRELSQAWLRWTLRAPELADIGQIAVLNLTGESLPGELSASFKNLVLPAHALAPGCAFVTCAK